MIAQGQIDSLAISLMGCTNTEYRLVYYQIAEAWISRHAKGLDLWGNESWDGWWRQMWIDNTDHFISWLSIDENLNPCIPYQRDDSFSDELNEYMESRKSDKVFLFTVYQKFMYKTLIREKNQAVMELVDSQIPKKRKHDH